MTVIAFHTQWIRVLELNATFNNISVISWRLVLFLEETWVPWENHWSVASHWQTLSHNVVVLSTPRLSWIRTHNILYGITYYFFLISLCFSHLFYIIKIQFIHWNSAKYQNLDDATGKENGISAICLFVQVSN